MRNRISGGLGGFIFAIAVVLFIYFEYIQKEPTNLNEQSINSSSDITKANQIDPMCNIIVYTSTDCQLCRAAIEAIESKGVRYCQKDINQSDQDMQTYDQLSGGEACGPIAVSYTHLTLPTIYSV